MIHLTGCLPKLATCQRTSLSAAVLSMSGTRTLAYAHFKNKSVLVCQRLLYHCSRLDGWLRVAYVIGLIALLDAEVC